MKAGLFLKRAVVVALGVVVFFAPGAVRAETYYVGPDGSDDNSGTQANPFKTVAKAVGLCVGGGEVVILPNAASYVQDAEIVLSAGITLRSSTGNPADVVLERLSSTKTKYRLVRLDHADARVSGVTIAGGRSDSLQYGGGVRITVNGGTLDNCVVTNCVAEGTAIGGGIYIEAKSPGLVDRCRVEGCSLTAAGTGYSGAGIGINGGTVRNTVVVRNKATASATNLGSAVLVDGGTFEYCTVVNNESDYCAGVIAKNGKVANCLIGACRSKNALTPEVALWSGTAKCFTNCVVSAYINDWCTVETDPFESVADDRWMPKVGSAALDAGAPADWLADAKDFAGVARVNGAAADIGAVERDASAFAASFLPSSAEGTAPLAVKLTARVANAPGAVTYNWDWNGDGTTDLSTGNAEVSHSFDEGNYRVKLTVTSGGASYAVPGYAPVKAAPKTIAVPVGGDIAAAIASAAAGSEIVLANGTHPVTKDIVVDKGVVIRGGTGNPEDVILHSDGKSHRVFVVCNQDAVVHSLVVENAVSDLHAAYDSYGGMGGGICMRGAGGTVSNCVVRGCTIKNWNYGGGGIGIPSGTASALVTHCVISNCQENGSGNSGYPCGGGALAMAAGTVRNCLMTKNVRDTSPGDANCKYGTVRIAGGTLENCTVADNAAGRCAGVWASGGSVVNCLIAGNRATVDLDANLPVWVGDATKFAYCVSDVKINDNADCKVVSGNAFVDADKGDYRPAPGTVSINGAERHDWMTGATDLAGNSRVRGTAPDVGCYEVDPNAFAATFAMSASSGFTPATVNFTVTPVNGGGEGYTCEWDWNGDGSYDETKNVLTASHEFEDYGEHLIVVRVTDGKSGVKYTTPSQVFKVYPKTLYVKKDNVDAASPYATEKTAAKDIPTALAAAADGCEIVVLPATFTVKAAILVDKGVHLRGQTGNPEDVILHSDGQDHRVLELGKASATVSSLVVENAYANTHEVFETFPGGYGAGIRIRIGGGTVSNCVVRNCVKGNYNNGGGGIGIASGAVDALVTHCVISNCYNTAPANSAYLGGGGALMMYDGVVRNCLFTKNVRAESTGADANRYGTVRIDGGTLENCTIAGNSAGSCAGVWARGGTVVNCLIAENKTTVESGENLPVWAGSASLFSHCVSDVEIDGGTDCKVVDKTQFVDAAKGDYRLAAGVDAIEAGVFHAWMTGAGDMDGNPRVRGDLPDAGCYEADPNAFSATFAMSAAKGFKPSSVTFTVTPVNDGGQGVTCEWDWNGDGTFDETVESTEASHTFTDYGKYDVIVRVTDKKSKQNVTTPSQRFTVYPKTLYVSKNGTPTPPYDQEGTAAPDITSALAEAAEGCEIVLLPDTYPITSAIYLNQGIVIRGKTGRPEDVILHSDGQSHRVFDLDHAGASVCSLVVENAFENSHAAYDSFGGYGAGIRIRAAGGVVSNCVVRNCRKENYNKGGAGIGIASGADAALVTHCVISNCYENGACENNNNYPAGGGALVMYGGTVRNCLFTQNVRETATGIAGCYYGTVRIEGGTLENCTVAGNSAGSCAGVWARGAGGKVVNCLIAGNTTTKDTGATLPVYAGEASVFSHCVSDVAIGPGNAVALTPFVDAANGNYRLAVGTAAVDGGEPSDWMEGATDLDATARVKGEAPDVGCYELTPVFAVGAAVDKAKDRDSLTVNLTMTVANAGAQGHDLFVDWGEGAGEEEKVGTQFTHTYTTPGAYVIAVRAYSRSLARSEQATPLNVVVAPSVIWVKPENEDAAFPYATRETAATNIAEAIELAVDGCEVRLLPGTYLLANQFDIAKAIAVRGETGRSADVVLQHLRTLPGVAKNYGRVVEIKNSSALLASVTVAEGYLSGSGAGVYLAAEGGTVSNCLVRNCQAVDWKRLGGGLYMAKPNDGAVSLVTHCVFTNCMVDVVANNARDVMGMGSAIAAAGGTVRNSLFTSNRMISNGVNSSLGATVYLRDAAMLENCTVVSNESDYLSGVYARTPGVNEAQLFPTIRNCVISANVTTYGTEAERVYKGLANLVDHCVADAAVGSAFSVEAPEVTFRRPARGDWRLRKGTVASDFGTYAAWMDGATDLRGNPRLLGKKPDAGCYERFDAGFSIIVR